MHTGPWSLVNCWREGSYEALYNMLMNINEVAVGLEECLGLDGDRCIRVIPRHTVVEHYKEQLMFPSDEILEEWLTLKSILYRRYGKDIQNTR